jgi:hypothetical protein
MSRAISRDTGGCVYTDPMQLHVARLCLDCQEVHDARTCPRCTSESFALLSRWVPAPERRAKPRPASSKAETYRQLLQPEDGGQPSHQWLKRGALLAALGVGGWLWRRKSNGPSSRHESSRGA